MSGYTTSAALSPASLEWAGMGAYLNAGGARCSSPGRGAPTSGPPSPLAPFMISCAVAGTARRDPPAAGAPPLAHKRQNTRKSKATSRGRATQLHCGAAQWECAQASSHCNAALPAHCILAKQASGAPARTRPPAPTSARGRRRCGCPPCACGACGAVSRQHPAAAAARVPAGAEVGRAHLRLAGTLRSRARIRTGCEDGRTMCRPPCGGAQSWAPHESLRASPGACSAARRDAISLPRGVSHPLQQK